MLGIKTFNTILYCSKWKETVSFYQRVLDLPVLTSLDWFIEFEISDTARLSIADESKASIVSNHGKGVTITFEVDDIQTTLSNLLRLGFDELEILDHAWGARVIYIHDPEGNRIEFWSSN
jgi:catechol 2,3-dioxygenase-like lactoylglutathione lyase family enzyme